MKVKAYLATHFFNQAGFEWTKKIAESIREKYPKLDLYVPQENGEINDKEKNDEEITDIAIAKADNERLKEANILIANLDGVEIDSGVSCEIGYFLGRAEVELEQGIHKPRICIGVYTDMRQVGTGDNHYYINLYTKGCVKSCGVVVKNIGELLKEIENFIINYFDEGVMGLRTGFNNGEVVGVTNTIIWGEEGELRLSKNAKLKVIRFEEDDLRRSGIVVYCSVIENIGGEGLSEGDVIDLCSSLLKKVDDEWLN